jgi:hypothetical protein
MIINSQAFEKIMKTFYYKAMSLEGEINKLSVRHQLREAVGLKGGSSSFCGT